MPGVVTAVNVGGTLSYLASDGLGSVSEALSTSGSATAQQLFAPYGTARYSSGTMPTARGFTGQYADSATGLQYFNARYYDPTIGQFGSADTTLAGGLNRYGYVGGNPTTNTDPSGHCFTDGNGHYYCGHHGGGSGAPPPPPGNPPGNGGGKGGKPHCSGCRGSAVMVKTPGCASSSTNDACWALAVERLAHDREGDLGSKAWLATAGALVLDVVALIVNLQKSGIGGIEAGTAVGTVLLHSLDDVLDVAMEASAAVGFALGGGLRNVLVGVSTVLHVVLGVLNAAIALYNRAGWFQNLLGPVITAAKNAELGPIQAILTVVSNIAGPWITNFLQWGAETLFASANILWWEEASIGDTIGTFQGDIAYCDQYGGCPALPAQ